MSSGHNFADKVEGMIHHGAADKTKKGEGSHSKGPGAGAEDAENDPHRQKVGDGTWDPSGESVAPDTITDKSKTPSHPSYEKDMQKKMAEKSQRGDDHTKDGGEGRGDVMDH